MPVIGVPTKKTRLSVSTQNLQHLRRLCVSKSPVVQGSLKDTNPIIRENHLNYHTFELFASPKDGSHLMTPDISMFEKYISSESTGRDGCEKKQIGNSQARHLFTSVYPIQWHPGLFKGITLPETKPASKAPENGWLEYVGTILSFWDFALGAFAVSFREGTILGALN